MKWFFENWSLLVVILVVVALFIIYLQKFAKLPPESQIKKVKEWLLYAVTLAEKDLGSGTGQLKLRYVYDMFLQKFPAVASGIPFEVFSMWVDEALEQMKHLLETNENIAKFVEGE